MIWNPEAETPTAGGQPGNDGANTNDISSNLTVDFGFVPTYSIGNFVWIDNGAGNTENNHNGQWEQGEPGVDGVQLELLDAAGTPTGVTTSTDNGYYLFDNLIAGTYQIRLAAENFATGGVLEHYQSCGAADEVNPNLDVDHNDNGLDSGQVDVNGISSGIIVLGDREPELEQALLSGRAGSDGSRRADRDNNLTVDFCVVAMTGVGNRLWIDEGTPSNRANTANNGIYDEDEQPLANITVEVFGEGQDADIDSPVATTMTDRFGCYAFDKLPEGKYYIHVPYYQTVLDGAVTKPLYAYLSSRGNDKDTGIDDDQGENGIDYPFESDYSGLMTSVFELTAGQEPQGERQCGRGTQVLVSDDSFDGTKDIGVLRHMQLGDYVWYDRNANGHQDAGEPAIEDAIVDLFRLTEQRRQRISIVTLWQRSVRMTKASTCSAGYCRVIMW